VRIHVLCFSSCMRQCPPCGVDGPLIPSKLNTYNEHLAVSNCFGFSKRVKRQLSKNLFVWIITQEYMDQRFQFQWSAQRDVQATKERQRRLSC
jgi:hypothetical protein